MKACYIGMLWHENEKEGGKNLQNRVTIKPKIAEKFRTFEKDGRVMFFSAPCGFGKTTVAHELLKGKAVLEITPKEFELQDVPSVRKGFILIDDLQMIHDEARMQGWLH